MQAMVDGNKQYACLIGATTADGNQQRNKLLRVPYWCDYVNIVTVRYDPRGLGVCVSIVS